MRFVDSALGGSQFRSRATCACLLAILACAACVDDPISTLRYDSSQSARTEHPFAEGDDDSYPTIDSCYLSGEKLSVFIVRLAEAPVQGTIDCPDPLYHDSWAQAGADLIDNAVGESPADKLNLVFLANSQVPYHKLVADDELLVGARYYAPYDVWVVVEAVRVALNGDASATTDTAWRTVDLPTSWTALVMELERDRGRACGRKACLGTVPDEIFVQNALKPGDPCAAF